MTSSDPGRPTHRRPGGALARRPLHFIWLLDASGSMRVDAKIQALNVAIRETIPHLAAAAADNPGTEVLVRALAFASGARWHVERPTPVGELRWSDLSAGGHTDMGRALGMVADELKTPPMPERAVSPVLVLVSDGHYTDDFEAGLRRLLAEPWGREARRLAIAIGRDVSKRALKAFIGDDSLEPLPANNPEALARQIQWASLSGVQQASQLLDEDSTRRIYLAQVRSSVEAEAADEW